MTPAEDAEPNRFTAIGARLTAAFKADPEYRPDDKMIIIMHDALIGGTTLEGYPGDAEAVYDLYSELSLICDVNDSKLVIVRKDAN